MLLKGRYSHAVIYPYEKYAARRHLTPTSIEARAAEAAAEQTLVDIKSSSSFTATATAHHRQLELYRPVNSRQDVTGKVYTLCTGMKPQPELEIAISGPQANPSCAYRACCGRLLELPLNQSLVLSLLEVSISFVYVEVGVNIAAIAYATVESDIFKPTKYGGKYTVTLIPGTLDIYSTREVAGQLLTELYR
jgi:hypothetical protein